MLKYYKNMDVTRGIGIFLVVLGHSIPASIRGTDKYLQFVFNFIYSFHMPLFFFISGFFAISIYNIKNVNEYYKFIKKKFIKLILPYFFISIIGIPFTIYMISNNFIDYLNINSFMSIQNIIYNMIFFPSPENLPVSMMWFIYTLFMIFLITPVLSKINTKFMVIVSFIFMIIGSKGFINNITIFNINLITRYTFYFYIGMFFNQNYNKYINIKHRNIIILIGFILLITLNLITIELPLIRSLLGIIICILISYLIQEKLIGKIFLFLGKHSYKIYLFSWFFQIPFIKVIFMYKLNINRYILLFLMLLAGFIPILFDKNFISKFIKKQVVLFRL